MQLARAIRLLEREYEDAKTREYIRNPMAYALYKVWKIANSEPGRPMKGEWPVHKDCDTCRYDDPIYEHSGFCKDCYAKHGEAPTKWAPAKPQEGE